MRFKRVLGVFGALVLLTLPIFGWLKRYDIYDFARLRNYSPPSNVAELADHTTMKAKTRDLFYVNKPQIEDRTTFSQNCNQDREETIILGCFISLRGVFIYNVSDPRLQGVMEVTAAHETLHAVYERLSINDRKHVDAMVLAAYEKVTNQRIRTNIEAYRTRDPKVVPNELHSILATEVRLLPDELENYYKKYFSDRQAIVAYSEKYEQEFTARKDKITANNALLTKEKTEIDQLQDSLKTKYDALLKQKAQMDAYLAAKQYDSYNALVPGYNSAVAAYNKLARQLSDKIDQYNALLAQTQAIALEENQLWQAIDSRPTVISQ